MPVIWQNCQSVNEDASDFGRTACIWRSVPVIWQNYMVEEGASPDLQNSCLYVEECASDLAELPVC